MTRIFLSASFPSGERGDAVAPYRPADIAAATASAVEAVLRTGSVLAFGGHPTISPIVLHVAGLIGAGQQVQIWQSEWFAGSITDEVHRLVGQEGARLIMTPPEDDLGGSLAVLREAMLEDGVRGAFFVGGMEGIQAEYDMLAARHPDAAVFAFEMPGGMSARLAADGPPFDGTRSTLPDLEGEGGARPSAGPWRLTGRAYGSLSLAALAGLGLDVLDRRGEL